MRKRISSAPPMIDCKVRLWTHLLFTIAILVQSENKQCVKLMQVYIFLHDFLLSSCDIRRTIDISFLKIV